MHSLRLKTRSTPGAVTGTIKDLADGLSTSIFNNQVITPNVGDSFQRVTAVLDATTALNNQSLVALRFDNFEGNDQMRIDNLTVTAVPEPASFGALAGLLAIGMATVRRRSRS